MSAPNPMAELLRSIGRVASTAVEVAASQPSTPQRASKKAGCTPCAARAAVIAAKRNAAVKR